MSTHNIGFYEDLTKISLNYHLISSNTCTHLISSAARTYVIYRSEVTCTSSSWCLGCAALFNVTLPVPSTMIISTLFKVRPIKCQTRYHSISLCLLLLSQHYRILYGELVYPLTSFRIRCPQ